ncbi:uncharacterized protein LOC128224638 [Mya arenaria]|uniref:uncharacterized protein LOC128224638 n=1 Tax=Mya arenaria TaxID=6604 RepID=UPI0022E52F0B|nr:uncharacterized protein LOC128224638 [Mya arenaria]XP_052790532.1 uncharacterized protein LOC128224638 [Mya arenaria]
MLSLGLVLRHSCAWNRATYHSRIHLRGLAVLTGPQTAVSMVDFNSSKQRTCIKRRVVARHTCLGIDLNQLSQHRLLNTNSNNSVGLETEQLGENTVSSAAGSLPNTTGIDPSIQVDAGFNAFFSLVEFMSKYLHFIYDFTGFNWCAVIALGILPIRFINTYCTQYLILRYNARLSVVNKKIHAGSNVDSVKKYFKTKEFKSRYPDATQLFKERYLINELERQKKVLKRQNKCEIPRLLLYSMLPMPVWIGFSLAIGSMLGIRRVVNVAGITPIEGLEVNGILWFQNLALLDPYHILPVVMAISFLLPLFISGLLTPKLRASNYAHLVQRLPFMIIQSFITTWSMFMMFVCWNLSSGIVYYWAMSGFGAVTFRLICYHPFIMNTMVPKGKWNAWVEDQIIIDKPYTTIWTNFKNRFRF